MYKIGRSQRTEAEDLIYGGGLTKKDPKAKDFHRDNVKNLKQKEKEKKEEFKHKQEVAEESKKQSNFPFSRTHS